MENEKYYIERLKAGSHADFTYLYERYVPRLYSFVFSLVKSKALSKDIVQEVFVRLWNNHSTIDLSLSFKAYLFKIAYNMVLNEFRRQVNSPIFADYMQYADNEASADNSTTHKVDFDDFCRALDLAKQKLTPRQREIFELNKEQGLSVAEIALLLKISEQSVRNQLSIALKQLRKQLCDYASILLIFLLF
ncbi:DNA-directed RNA polymerase sigma-70 factor [Bacteroidales bacterium]|nr:DNA-directed RNA polymerase sigma-70 factor [Bacteroidales bacterium]